LRPSILLIEIKYYSIVVLCTAAYSRHLLSTYRRFIIAVKTIGTLYIKTIVKMNKIDGSVRDELRDLRNFVTENCNKLESRIKTDGKKVENTAVLKDFDTFKSVVYRRLTELERRVDLLEDGLDDLDAYSRKNCLIVHGIEERIGEDIEGVVSNFFKEKFQINVESSTIDNIHRLGRGGQNKKYPRPIIVRFVSYLVRRKIWTSKKALKGTKYLITESLTKRRLAVYKKAKEHFGVSNTWTQDSKIIVLTKEGKKLSFTKMAELDKVGKALQFEKTVTNRSEVSERMGSSSEVDGEDSEYDKVVEENEGMRDTAKIVYKTRNAKKGGR